MTETKALEYQLLERESSDHLLEHDSRKVLGRYEEAASHALQAAHQRDRMGQMRFEAQEFTEAAEDWLSATACYFLANEDQKATSVLEKLHHLEAEGLLLPSDRPDLYKTLRKREMELQELQQKTKQFLPNGGKPDNQKNRSVDALIPAVPKDLS